MEVKMMVGCLSTTGAKPEEVEQEVVDGMSSGDGVQGYHAGVGLMNAVGLFLTFAVGLRLDCQLCGIDQTVAPKTASAWPDVAYRAHGVFKVAPAVSAYSGAHLYNGNEVLVGKRIDNESGSHGVGSQEDEIAITQNPCD